MPITRSTNAFSVAFPDVCRTPAPIAPVPIPYPNYATTAGAKQSAAKATSSRVESKLSHVTASTSRTATRVSATAAAEAVRLKSELATLHGRLLALQARNPDEWQVVLEGYVVAASALYSTLNNS